MVPNGVGVCFLKSGNLEELLTSFASHCIHCCSQANSMLFPIRLHFLYIRMKQWRNFIPLFVGKHRNRHVTTPAMVGLWHGFRTEDSFSAERSSTPNPTDSARFHYFYHAPSSSQSPTRQRGRICGAAACYANRPYSPSSSFTSNPRNFLLYFTGTFLNAGNAASTLSILPLYSGCVM